MGVNTIYHVTNQTSTFAPVSLIDNCIFFTFCWLWPSRSVFLSLSVSNSFQSNCSHFEIRFSYVELSTLSELNLKLSHFNLEAIFAFSSTLKTPALITSNLTNVHFSSHQQEAPISWQHEPYSINHMNKKRL